MLEMLLVSGFSALLGAWIGTRAALAKVRGERAFDRKLEWCETTADALRRMALTSAQLAGAVEAREEMLEALGLWNQQVEELRPVVHKGALYLRRDTLAGLVGAMASIPTVSMEDPPVEALRKTADAFHSIGDSLRDEIRSDLGLDSIKDTVWTQL